MQVKRQVKTFDISLVRLEKRIKIIMGIKLVV